MQKQEKNVPKEKLKTNKKKFLNLNFNLKYEIIEFLPIAQQFNQATRLNRRFNLCLNKKRIFPLLKNDSRSLIKSLSFNVEQLSTVKDYLLEASGESEEKINQILSFLLRLKYKNSGHLDLTEIKNLDCYLLSSFLAENSSLKFLFLFENKLGRRAENLKFLCLGLIDNISITDLYISQNKIGKNPTDLIYLNFLLLLNQNLTYVDFSYNRIGNNMEDVKHLANAIRNNKRLKSLNLSSNKIGSNNKDDFPLLCVALAENKTLEAIDLSFNFVQNNDENVEAFLLLMSENNNLQSFSVLKNPLEKNERYGKFKESGYDGRIVI